MKKSLACCLSVLVLAGCATAQDPPESQPTETASATPPSPAAAPKTTKPTAERSSAPPPSSGIAGLSPAETVYIGKLVQAHPRLREKSNDDLLGVGEVPCTLYDNGATSSEVNELLFTAAGVAYMLDEFVSIHGIGVAALCPEHIDKLG